MITTRIISTGACVPEQVITNDDLSKIVDTSDEWITQRTGIKRRHISAGENTSYFAINTARQVLDRAEVSAEDVDLDRKSTRLNSSHWLQSRMPSSA